MTTTDAAALPLAPPSLGVPRDLTASWIRRVVAVLLDEALLGAAAFLAAAVVPVSVPSYVPSFGVVEPVASRWQDSGAVVALVVLVIAMQAYLGSTPGKLVMGIAVVRSTDGRPVGMIRTLLRLVAHVLDGILMIGYLRPLWNLERKTFADSLAGTVVLRTDRPLPFAARRDPLPPLDWERAEIPPWRRSVAVLSVLVCAAGVAMGFSSASVGESGSRACSAMVLPAADVPIGTQPAFGSASVDVVTGGGTETRLGIERQRLTGEPSVTVRWEAIGLPAGSVARFAVLGEDGTPVWSVERDVLADGLSPLGSGEATLLEDGSIGLALSPEAAARYASAVAEGRWEVSVLDDQVTTVCLG